MAITVASIFILLSILLSTHAAEKNIITSPQPGQEYVFVQTQSSGARPISRKDKPTNSDRPFETAHKLPQSLTYALKESNRRRREASPADAPAPAPAGAIKLDPLKLIEKYKTVLKTTSTEAPKSTTAKSVRRTPTRGKLDNNKRRTKKAAPVTDPTPVLTTGRSSPRAIDDDIPLVGSGSEKQRSRIQIKKGPNGQEYEYEYVYYYYDDDVDGDKKSQQKTSNSHDGPVRGKSTPEPTANEVVPARTTHARGRQLDVEDPVGEERLPANTRFPPRSRNLATTPAPAAEEEKTTRGRNRGRPTTEATPAVEIDSTSEETQGVRGRTRPSVRRPSLDLVDSASFNTHSGTAGSEVPTGGPIFPQDLPAGPVRFLGATPNERQDVTETQGKNRDEEKAASTPLDGATETGETTTVMSAMDKVALDLYAISQGTQKLSGEDTELNTEEGSTGTTDQDATTLEPTTIAPTTEYTTPSTTPSTTTTTTTTTPAPTTSTTTEGNLKRFGNRGRLGGRKTTTTATPATETHTDTKPKKFGGRFGSRPRPGTRTTAEPAAVAEEEATKEDSKPSFSKPSASRPRFGSNRSRTRTTAAPASDGAEGKEEPAHSSTAAPSFRPRPRLPLSGSRSRTRTTAAPAEEKPEEDSAAASSVSSEVSSTTQRPRGRLNVGGGASRPALRPGPRINLARGRPGASTTTTTTTEAVPAGEEAVEKQEGNQEAEKSEKEAEVTSTTVQDNNPLNRLRNKNRLTVTPASRPKAAGSSPVQVRRVNPLLARRKPGAPEPSTSEAPQEEPVTEVVTSVDEAETLAPSSSTTSTTEEPRGLSKLLAGRRRLAARQPGTIN